MAEQADKLPSIIIGLAADGLRFVTTAPETEAPSVSSSSAGTSEVASRTKFWRSRARGPGTARYGVRRGKVAVGEGHEIRVKTSPKISSSDGSTAARQSQGSALAESLRNVRFRNDQPQNKTTMPRDLGCGAPDCDSPVPEPITPWYSPSTSEPLSMPPVVASTTFCMHNNQVPAGRELGFRKSFLMVPGSATRVGCRASSSFYLRPRNRI